MKWIIIIILVIVTLAGVLYLIGYFLPVKHQATYSVRLKASPAEVWNLITDYKNYQTWRRGLKSVVMDDANHWTETTDNGVIHYEAEIVKPNEVLATRIINKDLPFGGNWILAIAPAGNETQLTITENGEVYNPFFRFMAKYIFGHEATLRQYGEDLSKKINAE